MADGNDEDECEGCGHNRSEHAKGPCQAQRVAGSGKGAPHDVNWEACECAVFQEAPSPDPEPPAEQDA